MGNSGMRRQRRKIGILVPSSNTTVEYDFQRALPDYVSLHAARMWLVGSNEDVLERMDEDLDDGVDHLASAAVDLIVYACTGGSLKGGPGYDQAVQARIEKRADGIPAISASSAVLSAIKELGLKKLTVVTPYPKEMTDTVGRYMEGCGFKVLNLAGRNHQSNLAIAEDYSENIIDFAMAQLHPDSDGLFFSCTNWQTADVAGIIEDKTGVPVITSNQATIWATLKAIRCEKTVPGFGRLLAFRPQDHSAKVG